MPSTCITPRTARGSKARRWFKGGWRRGLRAEHRNAWAGHAACTPALGHHVTPASSLLSHRLGFARLARARRLLCVFVPLVCSFAAQTSHVHIHHKLDGGVGDTFYLWDLDRSSLSDFMLYLYRVLMHMIGASSLTFFEKTGR